MRLIALVLAFVLCFVGSAISDSIATPTDIEESVTKEIVEEEIIIEEIQEEEEEELPNEVIEEPPPEEAKEEIIIEDDDWGEIEIEFERQVFITMDKEPHYIGDEMSFVATLINFQPDDEYIINWQYSKDRVNWINIENEHQQTFTIVVNDINRHYWWRAVVEWRNNT